MSFRGRDKVALAAAALLLAGLPALAQTVPGGAASELTIRPIPGEPAATLPDTRPSTAPASAPTAVPAPAPGSRTVIYTLRQLGAEGPLALRGTAPMLGVRFGLRADEVVTAATLNIEGAVSPALIPSLSSVTVTVNGQYLATIPADRQTPAFTMEAPIDPALFRDADRLDFRLAGRSVAGCDDPTSDLLWATISADSTLTLTLQRLPPRRDLARLPRPFFEPGQTDALALPFVLPPTADDDTLRAAGIAASWFGQMAGDRGASFSALAHLPAEGNAVLVLAGGNAGFLPALPPIKGPTLALLPNPHDTLSSVLVIAGRTGAEAAAAASALAGGIRVLGGAVAAVQAAEMAARAPYDAPAWVPTDRPVKLGELVDAGALQGSGYTSLLHVPFRTAPDLYTWLGRPFALRLRWRAPPGPIVDAAASRLDVGLNGAYLASLPLAPPTRAGWLGGLLAAGSGPTQARIRMPVRDVSGADDLQLYFDARPLRRQACGAIPGDLRMAVDADSTLDLSRGYRFGVMPELAWFAGSGFPFTRMADLSQTAVVLARQPAPAAIETFLDLMGRFGAITGLPGARVAVARPDETARVAGRDLLVIGTIAGLKDAGGLLASLPSLRHRLSADPPGAGLLAGAQSKLHPGRSVVAILGTDGPGLRSAADALLDPRQAKLIGGDLTLLSGGQATSYRVGPTYTVGKLPFWLWSSRWLRDRPFGAVGALAGFSLLLVLGLFRWLWRRIR